MTQIEKILFEENYKLKNEITNLRYEVEYLTKLVNEYRKMPITELARKRQVLWDKLEAKNGKSAFRNGDYEVSPNSLSSKTKDLLLNILIEKKHAFVYRKWNTDKPESKISAYSNRLIILKTPQGYEFSIGVGYSAFAKSCIFELAAQILTTKEINEL